MLTQEVPLFTEPLSQPLHTFYLAIIFHCIDLLQLLVYSSINGARAGYGDEHFHVAVILSFS